MPKIDQIYPAQLELAEALFTDVGVVYGGGIAPVLLYTEPVDINTATTIGNNDYKVLHVESATQPFAITWAFLKITITSMGGNTTLGFSMGTDASRINMVKNTNESIPITSRIHPVGADDLGEALWNSSTTYKELGGFGANFVGNQLADDVYIRVVADSASPPSGSVRGYAMAWPVL